MAVTAATVMVVVTFLILFSGALGLFRTPNFNLFLSAFYFWLLCSLRLCTTSPTGPRERLRTLCCRANVRQKRGLPIRGPAAKRTRPEREPTEGVRPDTATQLFNSDSVTSAKRLRT